MNLGRGTESGGKGESFSVICRLCPGSEVNLVCLDPSSVISFSGDFKLLIFYASVFLNIKWGGNHNYLHIMKTD